MIGPVRQEILSGICDRGSFERLRDQLRAFPDEPLDSEDFDAAAYFTMCRAASVHGSNIDFLICAVARRRALPILTTDAGLARVAKVLPITTDSS